MTLINDLNDKQKSSVLSEAKRILVLAGAGSGKTKTLISKLLYLVREKNVKPSSILAITFTKNATNEIVDRLIISNDPSRNYETIINNKRLLVKQRDFERKSWVQKEPWIAHLTIKTFHSLCYQILRDNGNPVFDNKFKLILDDPSNELDLSIKDTAGPERPKDIIHKLLIVACDNKEYLLKLKRYILDYYVDKIAINKDMQAYENQGQISYTTLRGESVKSKSERDIADWLYRHSIQYQYEKETNLKDFNFKPDFFIPQADLFLEHISDKSYPMSDKEKQFSQGGRNYVTTYESMMNNTNLFNLAMERIVMGKITPAITEGVTLKFEEEFKSYHSKIAEFLKTIMRLQTMLKSEDIDPTSLLDKSSKNKHERVRVFYELAIPIINDYKQYCTNRSFLDFDDLIILTIKLLKENQEVYDLYQDKYKYVLVDEFQDVNGLQVKLLDLILKQNTQLFCVGDDWQSIYGFRGSNVDYILNFEKHYKLAEVHKLNVNYRSTQTIVGASNEVIKKNKNQIGKEIIAIKQAPSKIHIYRANRLDVDGVQFLVERVEALYKQGYSKDDILVLYRRNKMFSPYFDALKENHLFVSYKTIHASKGLEAKAVFILGLTEGSGGFPDIWLDDEIFRTVKDVKYDFLLEEERRLFYVAITRAKDELFLITESGSESQFIDEIPEHYYSLNLHEPESQLTRPEKMEIIIKCVKCNSGISEAFKFCPNCGHDQSIKDLTLQSNSQQSHLQISNQSNKTFSMDEIRMKHKNAYMPWTQEDDNKLEELYCKGTTIKELSIIFGRKQGGINSRIRKLELDLKYNFPK